ncbi:MAG: hypothetical protein ACI4TI_03120 [Christensenellales bacterium]
MNLILSSVWDIIINTFINIFSGIGQTLRDNAVVAILTFAILVALIVYRVIRNKFSTEVKVYKAVSKINDYLSKNPFITDDNLVEFNRLMMKAPKSLRFQWQRYIINRDKKPSDFLSEENCITKPVRTNSYKQGLKNFKTSLLLLCSFSAIFVLASLFTGNIDSVRIATMILSLVTPLLAFFVGYGYIQLGNIMYNAIMSDLFYSFANFQKAIDRAVINLPEAIDYEIIFTPKEIQNNIPALQEFLEQRALYDEEQLRKAQESEVEHETYNFDELGVDGSLVMQRALKESETYLGNRRRLLAEIETIQSEKSSVTKDFDEENKNYQRNLRDIREEISSLKSKIETVTNEITRSSLRRQQAAEVEKEQNIEKEIEKATNKFNARIDKLNAEIDKKRKEIDESKIVAEKSLTDEFKHFSDKTYKDLKAVTQKEVEQKIEELTDNNNDLAHQLEEKDKLMAEKLALYEDKAQGYDNLVGEVEENHFAIDELKNQISNLNQELEDRNQEIFEVRQELESRKREILKKDDMIENFKKKKAVEIYRYFDANGREFYFDDNENAYYLDEDGNAVYYNDVTNENLQQEENFEQNGEFEPEQNEVLEESSENAQGFETEENHEDENENQDLPSDEQVENDGKKNRKKKKNSKKNKNAKNDLTEMDAEQIEQQSEVEPEQEMEAPENESFDEQESEQENLENKDEGYKGIQDTLNKLAKAAQEKMQENLNKNDEKSETKSRKKKNKNKK